MTLVLLHGATGSSAQFDELKKHLQGTYDLHAIDFIGHGSNPGNETFSIEAFAKQVASFITELQTKEPVNIFGYSMGGYVATYIARHLNSNLGKIITLGTKFHWDEAVAAKESKMLQPDVIEQKVPAFAQQLAQRHGNNNWKNLLIRTAEMLQQMGANNPLKPEDYSNINTSSLIMLGDRDKMVTLDETLTVYRSISNAQLAILPNTPHVFEQADPTMIAYHINRFLNR